ncbi:MAG: hypothetical protein MPL62_12800 [Alphaproteobacteria bacterium]|nr:hypothetical protein [Alphaproteobacteria bacterium]
MSGRTAPESRPRRAPRPRTADALCSSATTFAPPSDGEGARKQNNGGTHE